MWQFWARLGEQVKLVVRMSWSQRGWVGERSRVGVGTDTGFAGDCAAQGVIAGSEGAGHVCRCAVLGTDSAWRCGWSGPV